MTRVVILTLSLVGAAVSALIWSAARSDFRFRGCHEMPRAEWETTVNCSDGWFGMNVFGAAAGLLVALSAYLIWRRFA